MYTIKIYLCVTYTALIRQKNKKNLFLKLLEFIQTSFRYKNLNSKFLTRTFEVICKINLSHLRSTYERNVKNCENYLPTKKLLLVWLILVFNKYLSNLNEKKKKKNSKA